MLQRNKSILALVKSTKSILALMKPTKPIRVQVQQFTFFFCIVYIWVCLGGTNIIVLNFDELTTKYNDAISEKIKFKSENETLKTELSKANRRNKLLQD